jgi:hypothetical protein
MVKGELGMELITEMGAEAKSRLYRASQLDKDFKADYILLTDA